MLSGDESTPFLLVDDRYSEAKAIENHAIQMYVRMYIHEQVSVILPTITHLGAAASKSGIPHCLGEHTTGPLLSHPLLPPPPSKSLTSDIILHPQTCRIRPRFV